MLNESKNWFAVSVHKSDGHSIDGFFVTDCEYHFSKFAEAVHPLQVVFTRCKSENKARKIFQNFRPEYVEINPTDFIFRKKMKCTCCMHIQSKLH